jgi:UDP-galactopyranose mutase
LICFSPLRWHFVFQRPQHLMVRFARERRVWFVEEPVFDAADARLEITLSHGVHVVVPHLPPGCPPAASIAIQRRLLRMIGAAPQLAWVCTPMAVPLLEGLSTSAIVYDCFDDLAGFAGAAPELQERERELLAVANLVFTGGHSLYEAKRAHHPDVYPFPSSADMSHFGRARLRLRDPADQHHLERPRIGYCGAIDDRMNLDLIRDVAARQPDWQFVLIGPTVGIDNASLPRAANLHYLGVKKYEELPRYLAGWDVAMLPFAHHHATRFIGPATTAEYLAAGCPVVSTSIRDVVRPYGEGKLVHIADTPDEFARAIAAALAEGRQSAARADALLATMSWDRTWSEMAALIARVEGIRRGVADRQSARAAQLQPSIGAASA